MNHPYHFDTLQLHAGFVSDPATGARAVPIYQTSAYHFEDVADAAAQLALDKPGHIYGRLGNPTTAVLEERITALEDGVGTVCFASGMAAILAAVETLAERGSEILAPQTIYGGTHTLFFSRLEERYGVRTVEIDPEDLMGICAAITDKTRLLYLETISNPSIDLPDFEAIAKVAHAHGIPVVLDNTFGTPYLFRAKEHGVDFVIHSLTKYLGGHGNSLGGSVTDLGTFCFKDNPRFPAFNRPDASYHGLVYADLGQAGFTTRLRAGVLRDTGACLAPMNAFLILMGIETLSLRMERCSQNALALARHLAAHPAVSWVHYPALEGDRWYQRAQKYLPRGAGGIFAFGIRGSAAAGARFIDALRLIGLVVNVADTRSMVVHPASTTHAQLSEAEQIAAGSPPDLIRFSAGIEDVADLIADLDQALAVSQN